MIAVISAETLLCLLVNMPMSQDFEKLVFLSAGLAIKFISLELLSQRYLKNCYEEVGKISKLIFYPVKSCCGIEVDSAMCTPCGLVYQGLQDR